MSAAPPIQRDARLGALGLAVAAGGFLAGVVVSVVFASIVIAVEGGSIETITFASAVASAAGLWCGFVGAPILVARARGGVVAFLGLRVRPVVDLPVGIVAGLASTYGGGVITSVLLDPVERRELETKAKEVIDRAHGPVAVAVLVVVLCIVTPVAEEVFFRGLVFRSLARLGPLVPAVVVGGAVFGAVHFSGGSGAVVANQLGILGLFGVLLCLLTWRTGRLGAAIVAHATFNLVTVAVQLLQR